MANFTTTNAVGQFEDLQDAVYALNINDTPFLSMIGQGGARNKTVEWVEENLEATREMALLEGADATASAGTPGSERSNFTQIFGDAVSISGTLEATDTTDDLGKLSREVIRKGQAIMRNIEFAMVGLKTTKALQSGGTGRKMDSALNQIAAATTNTDSSDRAFAESQVTDVLTSLYTEGGTSANTIMLSPAKKVELSSFQDSGISRRSISDRNELVRSIDIYVSDFGELAVVPNRHFKNDSVMIFDPELWEASYLRRMEVQDLAKTGDADKRLVVAEVSLKHAHQSASGLIEALS